MSVTPLPYTPAPASTDRVRAVVELLPVYIELADRIANTEFVPTALRRRPEAVLAALMSGAERGLGPMEALRSVHVIEGKPTLSAEAMRALVFAAGHEIDIVETTVSKATVVGRRAGATSSSPPFTWTLDKARRANLANKPNWRSYPEAMLLARASTDLCRAVFPDVIAGLASTEEVVDLEEPVITRRRSPVTRRQPAIAASAGEPQGPRSPTPPAEAPKAAVAAPVAPPVPEAATAAPDEGERRAKAEADYLDALGEVPDALERIPGASQPTWGSRPVEEPADPTPSGAHDLTLARRIHAKVTEAFPDTPADTRDRYRHALCIVVTRKRTDGPTASSSDLNLEEQMFLSDLLNRIQAGQATVTDGPADETVELRAHGWLYAITLDPPAVTVARAQMSAGVEGASAPRQPTPTNSPWTTSDMAGYRWARLDTGYFRNPKIVGISVEARQLHLASILHAVDFTTDGQIAHRSLRALGQIVDIDSRWVKRRAAELEAAGLWEPNGDGWHLHDFETMNPQAMREIVERDRAAWRERQARARAHRNGDVTP